MSENLIVGPDRRFARFDFDILTRARQGNADRAMFLYEFDPGTDVSRVKIDRLEGCRLGRRRELPSELFLVFELLFGPLTG